MINKLKVFDIYGVTYTPTVFGNEHYKTLLGFFMTCISGLLIIGTVFLIGQDFIYKENPRTNSILKKIPVEHIRYMPVNNLNFTVMWQLEDVDGKPIPEQDTIFYPSFRYQIYKKDEAKNWITYKRVNIRPKKCSETTTAKNPDIVGYNLDNWNCIDWDDITAELGESAYMGGMWSNDHLAVLRLDFTTCRFDYDTKKTDSSQCSSFDKVSTNLSAKAQYFSFVLPDYNFDTMNYENPISNKYNYVYWKASQNIGLKEYIYFSYVTLFDDKGWIFQDEMLLNAVETNYKEELIAFVQPLDFEVSKNQTYFSYSMYFINDERHHFRAFIKIQEVAANTGGIIKLTMMIFQQFTWLITKKMLRMDILTSIKELDYSTKKSKRIRASMSISQAKQTNSISRVVPESVGKPLNGEIKSNLFKIAFKQTFCCGDKKLRNYLSEEEKRLFMEVDLVSMMKASLKRHEEEEKEQKEEEERNAKKIDISKFTLKQD